jgi:hypothetical protein
MRHRLQHVAWRYRDQSRLGDPVAEADEIYQNAGEKRHPAPRPRRSGEEWARDDDGVREVHCNTLEGL